MGGRSQQQPAGQCRNNFCRNPLDDGDLDGLCVPCGRTGDRRREDGAMRGRYQQMPNRSSRPAARDSQRAGPPALAPQAPAQPATLAASSQPEQTRYSGGMSEDFVFGLLDRQHAQMVELLGFRQQQQQPVPSSAPAPAPAPARGRSRSLSRSPRRQGQSDYRQRDARHYGSRRSSRSTSPYSRGIVSDKSRVTRGTGRAAFEEKFSHLLELRPCLWCQSEPSLSGKAHTHCLEDCGYYTKAPSSKRRDFLKSTDYKNKKAAAAEKDKEAAKEQ